MWNKRILFVCSQGIPKLETAHPTLPAPDTISLLQTAQKNLTQLTNRSSDAADNQPQPNSTTDSSVDNAASSNNRSSSSDGDVGTPTVIALLTTTPAGKKKN